MRAVAKFQHLVINIYFLNTYPFVLDLISISVMLNGICHVSYLTVVYFILTNVLVLRVCPCGRMNVNTLYMFIQNQGS